MVLNWPIMLQGFNMRLSTIVSCTCILTLYTGVGFAAGPPLYRLTDIGQGEGPSDLNVFGVVSGFHSPDGVYLRGYEYKNGQLTDIGSLGGPDTLAYGINDLSKITGVSDLTDDFYDHAFLYSDGVMKDLGGLGGSFSEGNDLNDFDVVAGDSYLPGDEFEHGFLWEKGSFKDLGTFGGGNSFALSVNLFGEATGQADLPGFTDAGDPVTHAFVYSHEKMTDISPKGSDYSLGYRMNDLGEVTGTVHVNNNSEFHAFVYRGSRFIDLGTLGGINSHGYGINNLGWVVGRSTLTPEDDFEDSAAFHAFLMIDGIMYDLNSLIADDDPLKAHFTLNEATAVSDLGLIVVDGIDDRTGLSHGLLLKPVPRRTPWVFDKDLSSAKPAAAISQTRAQLHLKAMHRMSDHAKSIGAP
jgi:probable HAF family extracellular repeat protein